MIILDFDGVVTDLSQEWSEYPARAQEVWCNIVSDQGRDTYDLRKIWQEAKHVVENDFAERGRVVNDVVVAPAGADPYLWTAAVAAAATGKLASPSLDSACVLESMYQRAYQPPPLSESAMVALDNLVTLGHEVAIVANSSERRIRSALDGYAPGIGSAVMVIGDAGKFEIDIGAPPRSVPGLVRKVFAARPRYRQHIETLLQRAGTRSGVVIGDVAELDLLPLEGLSCQLRLLTSPHTLPHEKSYMRSVHGDQSLIEGPLRIGLLE